MCDIPARLQQKMDRSGGSSGRQDPCRRKIGYAFVAIGFIALKELRIRNWSQNVQGDIPPAANRPIMDKDEVEEPEFTPHLLTSDPAFSLYLALEGLIFC